MLQDQRCLGSYTEPYKHCSLKKRNRKVLRLLTKIAAGIGCALLVLLAVVVLIQKGVISVNPPCSPVLEEVGITDYQSYAYGWIDETSDFRFTATSDQIQPILEGYRMNKTDWFACDRQTSRNRLEIFLQEPPYWFKMKWVPHLEYFKGPKDLDTYWQVEMVREPKSGQCLLKIREY